MASHESDATLTAIRITSILTFLIMSTAIGLFVLRDGGKHRISGSSRWYHVLLRYTGPFTGGLFFSLGLIHVLPEADEAMARAFDKEFNNTYRLGPLMATVAFCVLLFLQRVAYPSHEPREQKGDHVESKEKRKCASPTVACSAMLQSSVVGAVLLSEMQSEVKTSSEVKTVASQTTCVMDCGTAPCKELKASNDELLLKVAELKQKLAETEKKLAEVGCLQVATVDAEPPQVSVTEKQETSIEDFLDHHTFNAYVLLMALCVHSVAEGLALGITSDSRGAFIMFVAILLHKWAATIAIANSFAIATTSDAKDAACVLLFSASTPFGISVGWAATVLLPRSMDAFLSSFTAGTFLYLAGDVVAEELVAGCEGRHKKFAAFLFGVALIYSVTAGGG